MYVITIVWNFPHTLQLGCFEVDLFGNSNVNNRYSLGPPLFCRPSTTSLRLESDCLLGHQATYRRDGSYVELFNHFCQQWSLSSDAVADIDGIERKSASVNLCGFVSHIPVADIYPVWSFSDFSLFCFQCCSLAIERYGHAPNTGIVFRNKFF